MEMKQVIPKFYEALERYNITYDKETGRLSNPIVIVIYKTNRKIQANRLLIFKDYFLVIRDDINDTRKIHFKHVQGYRPPDDMVEL